MLGKFWEVLLKNKKIGKVSYKIKRKINSVYTPR